MQIQKTLSNMCTEAHGKDLTDFKRIGLIGLCIGWCQLPPDHSLELSILAICVKAMKRRYDNSVFICQKEKKYDSGADIFSPDVWAMKWIKN